MTKVTSAFHTRITGSGTWSGQTKAGGFTKTIRVLDWRKRMSDTVAYALLVYTALQIFVTMSALKTEGGSLLPYLALIILVAAIIPSCRRFERRWNRLSDAQAADPALAPWFRRDRLIVWSGANQPLDRV